MFNVLYRFGCRRALALEQTGVYGVPPSSNKLLNALGCADGLKEACVSHDVFLFGMPETGEKSLCLRWSMRDLTAMYYAKRSVLNTDDSICATNLVVYKWQKKIISPLVLILFFDRFIGFAPVSMSDFARWCS
ncbi:hypothetical protein [Pseudomonas moorei]|uniref:hypothetical protein n=1 Tax=Pseudomonas moorei TaxID=395599 RepID=UPI001FF16329|nr:hypothetical protein [Pseudomonas moorei]